MVKRNARALFIVVVFFMSLFLSVNQAWTVPLDNKPIVSDGLGLVSWSTYFGFPLATPASPPPHPVPSITSEFDIGDLHGEIKSAVFRENLGGRHTAYTYQIKVTGGPGSIAQLSVPFDGPIAVIFSTSWHILGFGSPPRLDDPNFEGSPSPLSNFYKKSVGTVAPTSSDITSLSGGTYVTSFTGLKTKTKSLIFGASSPGVPGIVSASICDGSNPCATVKVVAPIRPFLSFPLRNKTAFSAKINSVFDHSMDKTYCPDNVVTAYTGEEGRASFYVPCVDETCRDFVISLKNCDNDKHKEPLYGFKNKAGTPFKVGGQYVGSEKPEFLYYDGHPGFDYRTKDQKLDGTLCPGGALCSDDGETPVLSAAPGMVTFIIKTPPCLKKHCPEPEDKPQMVEIDHRNGYFTRYLHLSEINVEPNQEVKSRGVVIGISGDTGAKGNPHLHFEVRLPETAKGIGDSYESTGALIPTDPYGWQGDVDPYPRAFNINLWQRPPTITTLTANPRSVHVNGQSTISVAASDPDGDPLTYEWSATCGMLSSMTGPAAKIWTAPSILGTCTIRVTVTDPFEASATASVGIVTSPSSPPPPRIGEVPPR